MSNDMLLTYESLSETELSTPTSSQLHPLGAIAMVGSGDLSYKSNKKFIYMQAAAALSAGQVVAIKKDVNAKVTSAAVASLAVYKQFAVAPVAFSANYYGWFQLEGEVSALVLSTVTSGAPVTVVNAGTSFTALATSSTTETTAVVGRMLNAPATGSGASALGSVFLYGNTAIVA